VVARGVRDFPVAVDVRHAAQVRVTELRRGKLGDGVATIRVAMTPHAAGRTRKIRVTHPWRANGVSSLSVPRNATTASFLVGSGWS
jgi:hypothetical protein